MSDDYYGDIIPTSSVPMDIDEGMIDLTSSTREGRTGSPVTNPVKLTRKAESEIKRIVNNFIRNGTNAYITRKKGLPSAFYGNIKQVILSIDSYYSSSNPVQPRDQVIQLALLPGGAKILKRIRTASFWKSIDAQLYEEPDWLKNTDVYDIEDIGDIFNYRYAFHWDLVPAEGEEDWRFALTRTEFMEGALEEFREVALSEISKWKPIEWVLEKEIHLNLTSSSTLYNSKQTVPNYLIKNRKVRDGARLPGKRCLVSVHPEGERDTIINRYPDLSMIS
jgi:hypothetical protein